MDIENLDTTAPDWDPEGEADFQEIPEAREHYEKVGKSKLRQNLEIELDSKYNGKRVSRKELEEQLNDSESSNEFEHSDVSGEFEMEESMEEVDSEDFENVEFNGSESSLESGLENDSESESEGNDLNAQLLKKLEKQEKQGQEMVEKMHSSAKRDAEQGEHVRAQLGVWEGLLEIRIRMQKAIDCANSMPQYDYYVDYFEQHKSKELETELEDTSRELCGIIDELVTFRKSLVTDEQMQVPLDSIKRKREDDMDEWIESTFQDVLKPLEDGYQQYRSETIDKWNTKIQVADGIPLEKKFKVINQSLNSQIENAFTNREKLVKKTRLNRSNVRPIGKPQKETTDETRDKHLNDYDDNIYDDGDYYQQLLKEFIDTRMQETNDPMILAMRYAKMKQMQKKKSKDIDTKASKGRKIRYQVQEKIQNFMAPEPRGTWHEEMCEELFVSLLGQTQDVKLEETITLDDGFRVM